MLPRIAVLLPLLCWATAIIRADWPALDSDDKFVHGVGPQMPSALTKVPAPLLADNFTCTMPGPIVGIHIWGAWKDDQGETRSNATAQFTVTLYEDDTPGGTTPTQPGKVVWFETFGPKQYNIIKAPNVGSSVFFDPEAPYNQSLVQDMYLYNFRPTTYPKQTGTQDSPKIYWLSVGLSNVVGGKVFGWKGADGFYDGAKFKDVSGAWRLLCDPINGSEYDLAFAVTTSPLAGANKTFFNKTGQKVDGVVIELTGEYKVYWSYDGWPGVEWPHFEVTTSAGNTFLKWTGRTNEPGDATHVGFLVPVQPNQTVHFNAVRWLWQNNPVSPCPSQFDLDEFQQDYEVNQQGLVDLANDISCSPPTLKYAGEMAVEYYDHPVPLDQLTSDVDVTTRNPIRRDEIAFGPAPIPGDSSVTVPVPLPPPNATYGVVIFKVNETSDLTDQAGATTDFFLVPIEQVAEPPPGWFCTDFNDGRVPLDSEVFGMAYVSTNGVLHLTDPTNDVYGVFGVNLPAPQTFPCFKARWKSLIGEGAEGGADGYSFNVADDLPDAPPYGNPGEEGAGTGLTVTVDTWDNGDGEAPGLEIKWRGQRVAFTPVSKPFLRKNEFVPAEVRVGPDGLASFSYDGVSVSVRLTNYTGLTANRYMFGARTGGASDRHWIDDLCINDLTAGGAPTIRSAGSLNGSSLNVSFTAEVDPVTAMDPANYRVNNGPPGAGIVPPLVLGSDGQSVVIHLSPALSGSFAVTASGVQQACPGTNAETSTGFGRVRGLLNTDLGVPGDPVPTGSACVGPEGAIEVTAGGSDIWGTVDHGHFIYAERCGDFDVSVKVARLDLQNEWSKAGLMARVSLDPRSRQIDTYHTPSAGANQIEAGFRRTGDGETLDWGLFRPAASQFPNIRLQRLYNQANGTDRFIAYHWDGAARDGEGNPQWNVHADTGLLPEGTMPKKLLVGLITSSRNNGVATTARFTDFSLSPQVTPPLAIRREGTNVVLSWPLECAEFSLYESEDLSPANWIPLTAPVVRSNGWASVTVLVNAPRRFFRLGPTWMATGDYFNPYGLPVDPPYRLNAVVTDENGIPSQFEQSILPASSFSAGPIPPIAKPDEFVPAPPSNLSPVLEEWLQTHDLAEQVHLIVTFHEDLPLPLLPELTSEDERNDPSNRRALAVQEIATARGNSQARLLQRLAQFGEFAPVEPFWIVNAVEIVTQLGTVLTLRDCPDVAYLQPVEAGEEPPGTILNDDVDDGRRLIGSDPYYGLTWPWIGLLDSGVRSTHVLFNNPRYLYWLRDCVNGGTNCNTPGPGFDTGDNWNHGTSSAAIICGNNRLGNPYRGVSAISTDSWKIYTPAGLHVTATLRAIQNAVGASDEVLVGELQAKEAENGAIATAADNAYASGTIFVAANGNFGPNFYTVRSPAIAHKVIGVGAFDVISLNTLIDQGRGPATDGRYKPDIQAPSNTETASATSDTALQLFGGTSGATPYAGAAAMLSRNWLRQFGTYDYGQTYAFMILYGQRSYPYDNIVGAGPLKMGTNGFWKWGKLIVVNQQIINIPISVPAGRRDLQAALWWPESATQPHNDIDLYLADPAGVVRASAIAGPSVFERTTVPGPLAPGTWQIRVRGCGVPTGYQFVYWAARF